MKLHLGCGEKRIAGYVNIDFRKLNGVDDVADIQTLPNYKENTIDTIYASHVLEHFRRHEYFSVLKRWYNILKSGGTLRIAVPDIEAVVKYYTIYEDLKPLRGLLWGGQTYEGNYHYMGYDFKTLSEDLQKIGFKDVKKYDWRKTEHSHIDDYSQCYLPHMEKETGMLMSLNIECIK